MGVVDRDARRLPQAAQEELRRRAVRLVEQGESQVRVAELFGVARQAVGRWVKAHREGGEDALAAGKRGRRHGQKTLLSLAQQAQISRAIAEKNPDQLRLPGFLWTRALVCELIERRYGIRVAEKTAGAYLRRWGFTPQKPLRRAYEQSYPRRGCGECNRQSFGGGLMKDEVRSCKASKPTRGMIVDRCSIPMGGTMPTDV